MSERSGSIVDLHCHTYVSDNTFSIEEVVVMAKNTGVSHLAITDHDTTMGLEEAARWGGLHGVEIIPGIEISAADRSRGRRAHILGYYIEPGHPALTALCDATVRQRHQASEMMVERIVQEGYDITWEQVQGYARHGSCVYKQHIMHALMDRGYCEGIHGELEKRLFSRGGAGKPPGIAFVPIQYVDAIDAIRAIAEAGGVPVLAHPGQLGNFDAVEQWVAHGLSGIEAYHPSHKEEDVARCLALAERFHLVVTGGSDFHGGYGSGKYPLGSVNAGYESVVGLMGKRREPLQRTGRTGD